MGVPKISDHIWIQIKMPNPNQEPSASSKTLNQDLKDMDVLCAFKNKIEIKNLDHWYIKNITDHIQIKIKIPNPNQEHQTSSKAQN